jgi:single-stranded-DNA-specific exonuclease
VILGRAAWVRADQPEATAALAAGGISPRLAPLLARRGLSDAAAANEFLEPRPEQLHDPFRLFGMGAAVERLLQARERGDRVAVVGDYDVDGVTATAMLLAVFRACGLGAEAIVPHRMREGYGFQPVHVERARDLGCRVIVTADCGATAHEAARAALAAGFELVITDHHLPDGPLPEGVTLVNPRQELCDYPFPDLAGVGLALKLALALAQRVGRTIELDALLRIACLGTIADLVPLLGENRVIAALGLRALGRTRSPGLRALMEASGLRPPVMASDVAFRLGPRLNAAGRLQSAESALELLLTRDEERARVLAAELDGRNRERQGEEARVLAEAKELVTAFADLPPIVALWASGWHKGVVGIAAGRLARELARPVLLLAVADGLATGSGRSVPGVHLHGFLARWQSRYRKFGGHAQAIGMTIEETELESVRSEWVAAAVEFGSAVGQWRHEYELELEAGEVGAPLLRELDRLEPHGQGNAQPLARVSRLRVEGEPRRFGSDHLSARARGAAGGRLRLVGWGWAERQDDLSGEFDALGYLERDRFDGEPALRLIDARPARDSAT